MRTTITSPLAETAHGAIAESVLRACVHCGMCNATCPTYQLTGDELDGPRGRIYLIKQALEGQAVGRISQQRLDGCLSCRACETTCPSGVEYHRLLDVGREVIGESVQRPWRERLARWLIRATAPYPRRIGALLALGRAFRFALPGVLAGKVPARAPAVAHQPARHDRRMALLEGCVQAAAAPHFNALTMRVFDRAGVALAPTPGVGCCGAVHFHTDDATQARRMARRNIDAWTQDLDAGAEAIVVNASGCAAFIRDYPDVLAEDADYAEKARRVAAAVRDPVEILEKTDFTLGAPPAQPRIAVHEPCTLRHGLKLPGRIGALLAKLGYEPQPVADSHLCCGSAGAYSLLQPAFAGPLKTAKLAALNASAPAAIYTANIGCWMHLADGSPAPVRHWIEAVDAVVAAPG
jgi:glycolate oxidase iron-sulfur subunit